MPIITIPSSTMPGIVSGATGFLGNISPFLTLLIGVPLAFFVISWAIGVLRRRNERNREEEALGISLLGSHPGARADRFKSLSRADRKLVARISAREKNFKSVMSGHDHLDTETI